MFPHNELFEQQIWKFFCDDLESCLKVSKIKQSDENSEFSGGLNFTAALAIFSVIELCAGWWKGKETNSDIFAEFMQRYFSKYYDFFKDTKIVKQFYEVFRNGLSHQWAPKASGIAMQFGSNWIIGKDEKGILILNVPAFFKITKKAFTDFEKELNENEQLRKGI